MLCFDSYFGKIWKKVIYNFCLCECELTLLLFNAGTYSYNHSNIAHIGQFNSFSLNHSVKL